LLAQARTAKSSIDSLWALKLRELTSNDYTDLINRLNKLADRHSDLVETSQTLADVDRSLLPESLTSDLRSAVEDGDIERIDALVAKVERAERLFDQLEDLRQTIEQSSLSVSTANYSEFVTQELEQTGGVFEGVTLGRVFEALADGVEAYESSRGAFDVFDVTAVESTLTARSRRPTRPRRQHSERYATTVRSSRPVRRSKSTSPKSTSRVWTLPATRTGAALGRCLRTATSAG